MRNLRLILLALWSCSLAAFAQTTNLPDLVEWDVEAEVAVSMGYRENVLRSTIATENSSFIMTDFEASVMRFSTSGRYFMLYFFGEDIRYFNAPSVNYEQFLSGVAQGGMPAGENDDLTLLLNYLYQHQVVDVSETEVNQNRLLVLGHSAAARPGWEHRFGENWETGFEAGALRQIYEQDLDHYTEFDGEVLLVRKYGHRSDVAIGYQLLQRYYDTREQYDDAGLSVPGTDLIYQQNEFKAESRHYWDEARNWRSSTRVGFMLNRDNGSGYFDYDRLLLREQLRWDNEVWSVYGSARYGRYIYSNQPVGAEERDRSYVSLDFNVERSFGRHWAIRGAGEHEWNMSNNPLDEYESWMVNIGLRYTF